MAHELEHNEKEVALASPDPSAHELQHNALNLMQRELGEWHEPLKQRGDKLLLDHLNIGSWVKSVDMV